MADEKTQTDEAAAVPAEAASGELLIQKVYVKDLSFEAPNAPHVFSMEWKPTVDIHFQNEATSLADEVHEVVLSVTVTVRFEEETVYLIEAQQAGIFKIAGFPEDALGHLMATMCPNILFPFVRETIADTVARGGFPQLLLAPVNFEHLYAQEVMRQRAAQGDETH